MDSSDLAFFKAVIAFLLVAGTGMGAFWLWLGSRSQLRPGRDKTMEALREENARLHAELSARTGELEERVGFVERRLFQEREASRLPQPPARTPG
jgi:hypothetical protein